MDNPTDAAIEAKDKELWNEWLPSSGTSFGRFVIRHFLTRQPGPEDVDRIIETVWPYLRTAEPRVKKGIAVYDSACDCAREIIALYPAPPVPARAPTRSALDSALDPMLGNTPVRKAVVDAVLGLFESARRPLTEAIIQELLLQTAEATHDLACAVSDSMAPQSASDIDDVRARLQSVINKLADMDDLRASATPKAAAFLPEDYSHVADLLHSNMVCEDQANLRAILSNNLNMIIAALRAGGV